MLRTYLFTTALVLAASTGAFAKNGETEPFSKNIEFFRNALRDADMPINDMEKYIDDATLGETDFRLSEEHAPWAGNYYSMPKGGIARRWNKNAADEQRRLSAIEKYDLYVGNSDRRATNWERTHRGDRRIPPAKGWEGFCNGMRCAGFLLPEPASPITVKAADGTDIVFEPADLKALAGASYFYVERYAQIGSPTKSGEPRSLPNPAVFDLALRYHLAERNKAFVIDSHTGTEIWNESVIGFRRAVGAEKVLTGEEAGKSLVPSKKSR